MLSDMLFQRRRPREYVLAGVVSLVLLFFVLNALLQYAHFYSVRTREYREARRAVQGECVTLAMHPEYSAQHREHLNDWCLVQEGVLERYTSVQAAYDTFWAGVGGVWGVFQALHAMLANVTPLLVMGAGFAVVFKYANGTLFSGAPQPQVIYAVQAPEKKKE